MELSIKSGVLLISILFSGITAGLCFTWTNAITPGIGKLDDLGYLQSFQSMNRAIINPAFLIVFFGPVLLLFLNAFMFKGDAPNRFWPFLTAALLFFAGVGLVTIFKNVPLNEMLDKTTLESVSKAELASLRKTFENSWNRWHMVRTVTSNAASILLIGGTLWSK